MSYKPNFSDPRVRRVCLRALEFMDQRMLQDQHWLSTREISRHFSWSGRPLGKYLKDQLLICVDDYFNMHTGQCKQYRKNPQGQQQLLQDLGLLDMPEPKITSESIEQLVSGDIEYTEKGHREYHPLQNLPKRVKRTLLVRHGYRYEYDIECAAQTLLLQHAQHLGMTTATPALNDYIADRQAVRLRLSKELGISESVIKKILTAILTGAPVSTWHKSHVLALVNYNTMMISEIQNNQWIQQYQRDVRAMWLVIRKTQVLEKSQRFNAKMKSEIYRILEDSVRSVIKRYLRKHQIRALIEHDGWSCDTVIETDQLCFEIKTQTGFVVKFDWTIYESESL